jgi:subtilisin
MTNKHYTRVRTLVLALAAALSLLLGIAPGAAWAQPDPPDAEETSAEKGSKTDAPPKTIDSPGLLKKAEDEGSVRVIVGLEADFEPEGKLSQARADEQRQDIEGAREGLRSELEETEFRTMREFETIPYVALEVSPEALEALERSPKVSSIHEDRALPAALAESVPHLQAPDMWQANYSGHGQTVAILDTGVDADHPFLGGRVVEEACFADDDQTQEPQNEDDGFCPDGSKDQLGTGSGEECTYSDACDHGTHVAGIAAGNGNTFSGVAPYANIMSVQVFHRETGAANCAEALVDPCALTFESDFTAGLLRVYALRDSYNFSSVNMSLGGGQYFSNCDAQLGEVKAAIDNLRSEGIATVIAAGNDGYTNSLGSPACISSAVSVGSTTDDDEVSDFSNAASFLDLLAPGSSIESSVPTNHEFDLKDGTSMAAPHVAGAWALLKQQKPSASVSEIQSALQSTGTSATDSRSGGTVTKKRINISDALAVLSPLANDSFMSKQVIRGTTVSVNDTNVGATRQALESDHLPSDPSLGENSVWYRWKAPLTGQVMMDTCTSNFDTVLAVYSGGPKASDNDSCASPNTAGSKVTFDVVEDQSYFIAVAGVYSGSEGTFTLKVNYGAPANDNFANAQTISGTSATTTGDNLVATRQSGEPDHLPFNDSTLGENSVWYNWTAPSSGKAIFNACDSDFIPAVAAYTGNAVGSLSQVASSNSGCAVTFDATAGTTYRIAVAGGNLNDKEGTFTLGVDIAPEVTATKPSANATNVGRSVNVTATFSEAMDPNTISTTTFKLVRQGTSTPVSTTVSYDPATKTATLNPSTSLKRGATYTATVTTGAKDEGGNPLAQQKTWSFKVKRR